MAQDLTGLNSLRQALTPYEDVKFELNLNRHPKAHKNKSLIYAENMKLSNDGSVLENEEDFVINNTIKTLLSSYYSNNFEIIHIIPCNTELVLFVREANSNNFQIWRYREKTDNYRENISIFYDKEIPYNGGEFSGTFTYTSNDSLIIAFCEYPIERSRDFMSPMMTINLGTHTKGRINADGYTWDSTIGEFNDRNLEPYKLPICPEVRLPQINNVRNIKGNSYIGTYYVYIRYKINKYDYTQWFSIGYPIVNEFKQNTILHKKVTTNKLNKEDGDYEDLIGANPTIKIKTLRSYINKDRDLINSCINLNINHKNILYEFCQIGFICISKTYTKYFITSDLELKNVINVSTDINKIKEEVFNTNIYENYYNVKNIINKNNKLYISNYRTKNDKNIDTSDIAILLKKGDIIKNENIEDFTIKINEYTFNKSSLEKSHYETRLIITDKLSGTSTRFIYENVTVKFVNFALFLKSNGLESYLNGDRIKLYYFRDGDKYSEVINVKDFEISVTEITIAKDVLWSGGKTMKIVTWKGNSGAVYSNYKQGPYAGDNLLAEFYYTSGTNVSQLYVLDSSNMEYLMDFGDETLLNKINIPTDKLNIEDYLYNNVYYYNFIDNTINNNILTGLCKGEVYDFYIHFIDKYGHITDGYKIENKDERFEAYFNKPVSNTFIETAYKVCFHVAGSYTYVIPADFKIFKLTSRGLQVNVEDWFIRRIEAIGTGTPIVKLSDTKIIGGVLTGVPTYVNNLSSKESGISDEIISVLEDLKYLPQEELLELTYGDIFDIQPIIYEGDNKEYKDLYRFIPYYNSKNELFFKVPKLSSFRNELDGEIADTQLGIFVWIDLKKYKDYVSYFITHKKLEKIYTLDGFGNEHQLNNIILNDKFESGNIIKRYMITSDIWDILNPKCVLQEDIIHKEKYYCYVNLLNKLAYAEDAQLNRNQRQTTLYLSDNIVDFKGDVLHKDSDVEKDIYAVYYLEILNLTKDRYLNNKNLYRLGNILDGNYYDYNGSTTILEGLNGIYDKHVTIKYGARDNGVVNIVSSSGEGSYGEVYLYENFGFNADENLGLYLSAPARYHKIPSKTSSNNGDVIVWKPNGIIGTDIFYRVIETLNLFNYKITNIYDTWINFYNKFDPNSDYLNEFNRTIYRSQVISDEGRTNNWRWFENDAYKNIEENKGNIVNLLPIGNYLYVHTEHSLYAFSEDNTLSMNNQNLQVATPDIFDTEYKEVFISKLGYGGIQDKHAWVSGQFGYMWYNNDTKQIFKVYGNSMDIISKDIQEFLENQNIKYVRFANDIKNNRVLINIRIKNDDDNQDIHPEKMYKDYVLSYNILSKTFISFHDYSFDKTYNTKLELYFLQNKNTEIHQFIEDVYGFKLNEEKRYYKAYFILNPYYREIKYLETLIYKLRKRKVKNHRYISSFSMGDFVNYPVEKTLLPYPGQSIRVFNDLVDTIWNSAGTVEPVTNMPNNEIQNYNEPYWDLGNWNFNYLRDTQRYPNNIFGSSPEARLFGNYFVIAFNFGHVTELIEFESLDTNLTQDKNL